MDPRLLQRPRAGARPAPPPPGARGSLQLRPSWAGAEDYAPTAPVDLLDEGEAVDGTVSERLLRCHLETDYRGGRQGLLSTLFDVDATPPELTVIFSAGGTLGVRGEANSPELLFGAPAVHLEEGDRVGAYLLDRKFMGAESFDRIEGFYGGSLPLELHTELSRLRCDAVPEAVVQARFEELAPAADEAIQRYRARLVDLDDEDLGATSVPHPRLEIEALAALRGWAHPQVRERVESVQEAEDAFDAQLIERLAGAELPEAIEGPGLGVASRGVRCPFWGYERQSFECALELELTGFRADGFWPLLVRSDGSRGFEHVANPGESLTLIGVEAPFPVALRVWTEDGPRWMSI